MEMEQFFEKTAIRVSGKKNEQYFYGDNLSGFYEGVTFKSEEGSGYLVGDRAIYRDFVSKSSTNVNRREEATRATIFPYGIQHQYKGGPKETFMLLTGQSAVALKITTERPQVLSLFPLLDFEGKMPSISISKNVTVFADESKSEYVAVSSSTPFTYAGLQRHATCLKPWFRVGDLTDSFMLYIAFADTRKAAVEKARDLVANDGAEQHRKTIFDVLTRSDLKTNDEEYNKALVWAKLSSYFMVVEEFGKGIWAGLPWFRDNWGRDTFIALPGTLLATGLFDEAKDVIRNFFKYQNKDPKSKDYGRVPNRVARGEIIYNTTDGTPWLVREVFEYLCYTGDLDFVKEVYPSVKLALDGPIKHYVDAKGFLAHEHADTWMDAKIEGNLPWSARGNRANDIQALWFTALQAGTKLAKLQSDKPSATAWKKTADKLKKNFPELFWSRGRLADRVEADGRADFKVRPNQLMVISVPLIDPLLTRKQSEAVVKNAVTELLYPYGIASLSQNDPYFHPYHHNDEWHHFDAAYHNGTVWGWNAGFTTTAMCRHGQKELAWKLAKNLSAQILNDGCLGAMSELIVAMPNKKGDIELSGTWAQAWSTSEFVRNAYQDFCGFNPRLLDNKIDLKPRIPKEWNQFSATYPFGENGRLRISYKKMPGRKTFIIQMTGHDKPVLITMNLIVFDKQYDLQCEVHPDDPCTLTIEKNRGAAVVEKESMSCVIGKGKKITPAKPLKFARPSLKAKPKSIKVKNYLQDIIEAGKYK